MTYESFKFSVDEGIAHITLDQAERGNPIDLRFNTEFSRIATECDEDQTVRCVLIDATGKFFGVGADLKTMNQDRAALPIFVKNATVGSHSALSRFARMNAPVVVAVHAMAVGGFVALCAAADFCMAARSAKFYAAYTGIGLVPDAGGTTFIPRRIGVRRAAEFFMRNQMWDSATALEAGLLSHVVDDDKLADAAWALARELAAGPTLAFGEIKNLLLSTGSLPIEAQMEQEARAIARVTRSEDAWNGICEVAARRKPEFKGR